MKKKLIIFTAIAATALCVTGSIAALTNNNVVKDLVSSTVDFENENQGIDKIAVRKSATATKLKVSKIYAQYAHNNQDGYDYLRFATSVKGNYSDITYTRSVEGKEDEVQAVHSVYKGISANGEITYSNGSDLRTEAYTSTEGCYWACYTIKFTTDTYKDKDITIKIRGIGKNPELPVSIERHKDGYMITTSDKAYAPAIGQPLVLYRNNLVIGGGIVDSFE
jgi:tRNA U34 2-thiouridine synthase MnmA/TrmU